MKPPGTQTLRFSPTAWGKLLYLRDLGPTEVGGFGISAADDLLYLDDIRLVSQICSPARVAFADEAVADFFDEQVDLGRHPEKFGRIWVHTHPGECALPSTTDEETFDRVFGQTQWAVMFILARGGECYARLRFHVGPQGEFELPVEVDFCRSFDGCNWDAWSEEYLNCVQIQEPFRLPPSRGSTRNATFNEDPVLEWDRKWFEPMHDEHQRKAL